MRRHAVLIQDISGFRAMVDPHLQQLVEPFVYLGLTLDGVLRWTIQEELWNVYQIPVADGRYDPIGTFEQEVYQQLYRRFIAPTLGEITAHFIKVPRIYGDQALSIAINRYDLRIYYYSDKQLTYPS